MSKYKVLQYDTWGNSEEGWDVNDAYVVDMVELGEGFTDNDVLELLFNNPDMYEVDNISSKERVEIILKDDGKPVFALELTY